MSKEWGQRFETQQQEIESFRESIDRFEQETQMARRGLSLLFRAHMESEKQDHPHKKILEKYLLWSDKLLSSVGAEQEEAGQSLRFYVHSIHVLDPFQTVTSIPIREEMARRNDIDYSALWNEEFQRKFRMVGLHRGARYLIELCSERRRTLREDEFQEYIQTIKGFGEEIKQGFMQQFQAAADSVGQEPGEGNGRLYGLEAGEEQQRKFKKKKKKKRKK